MKHDFSKIATATAGKTKNLEFKPCIKKAKKGKKVNNGK